MTLNPRLLLATEDVALARTLSWLLKENGYDVVTSAGSTQLGERLEQEVYDLLVLDLANGGAPAMGRLAVARVTVKKARFQSLEVDELTVRRLRVLEREDPPAAARVPDR